VRQPARRPVACAHRAVRARALITGTLAATAATGLPALAPVASVVLGAGYGMCLVAGLPEVQRGHGRRVFAVLDLRPIPFDHPDSVRLIAEIQQVYRDRYGNEDVTPVDPAEFAAPLGYFVIGYADGAAVACGGWRAAGPDAELRAGDAEIKRMYVHAAHRGRGYARAVLAHLERTAAEAGQHRMVLETGTLQPEAMALYAREGYAPMPNFGAYRDSPHSRCYAKALPARLPENAT